MGFSGFDVLYLLSSSSFRLYFCVLRLLAPVPTLLLSFSPRAVDSRLWDLLPAGLFPDSSALSIQVTLIQPRGRYDAWCPSPAGISSMNFRLPLCVCGAGNLAFVVPL
jgi:hypothetical protein